MEAPFCKIKLISLVFKLNLVYSVVFVHPYTINIKAPFCKVQLMYTRLNFRKLIKSILTYEMGLPYSWYTAIQRLQSIPDLIFKNFKHQFYPTKRGFHIDGIRVYEDYRVYKI